MQRLRHRCYDRLGQAGAHVGIGRIIGATFAAAVVAAVAGGLALLFAIFAGAQIANPGVGFTGPASAQVDSVFGGIVWWSIASLLIGFLPALCGAVGVLLPAHLVLARTGRQGRLWYLAAGCAAGVLSILVTWNSVGYLRDWALVEGLSSLLISAAIGGPAGALVFRRIVLGRRGAANGPLSAGGAG
jgi:hypothetical protein